MTGLLRGKINIRVVAKKLLGEGWKDLWLNKPLFVSVTITFDVVTPRTPPAVPGNLKVRGERPPISNRADHLIGRLLSCGHEVPLWLATLLRSIILPHDRRRRTTKHTAPVRPGMV